MTDRYDAVVQEDTQPFATGQHAPMREQRRGGCGCWLPLLVTLFLVATLVAVGLFLPPINLYNRLFGTQYVMLNAQANAAAQDGLTLIADPANVGTDFGVVLASLPVSATSTDRQDVVTALAAVPPGLARQSALYIIDTTGTQPETLALSVALPENVSADVLDLYGWYGAQNAWHFIPSRVDASSGAVIATVEGIPDQMALFQNASNTQPLVIVPVDAVQVLSEEVGQLATIVAPGGMQPGLDGKLIGSLAPGYDLNRGYLVMPVVRNFADPRAIDSNTVSAILGNRTLRSEHVAQAAAFASNNGFAGVIIDYRDIPVEQREGFSAFVTELGARLKAQGLRLAVVVPAAVNNAGAWDTGAYDWQAIGAAADIVQINLPLDPTVYASGSDRLVEAMLRWAVGEMSRAKIVLGLSARSVRQAASDFTTVGYSEALAALGDVQIDAETTAAGTVLPGTAITARLDGFGAMSGLDTTINAPFIDFLGSDGSPVSRVWLTTPEALRFRMDRTATFGLSGVAFNDLLSEGLADGVLQTILDYKTQIPALPAEREIALRWRIEGAGGVLSEVTTGLNEPLTTTLAAPDGNYAINVAVVGSNGESPRSGAAVALFAPTATPTPLPTATPTPVPTATPVPVVQPVAPAAPAQVAVQPGAGSIVAGSFEYGGHVTNPANDSAAAAMRSAGMTWMKYQVRYTNGMGAGSVAGVISDAKARGFKILLGIVGVPGELAAGGAGYVQQFASFLGGVAALGPDAIEVWNEPNLDREWPTGQISGAAYADMLRQAYQAIKGANGGVLVISGAPAPTGAEAAFPGQVVNDDNWLRDVVNAGGLQWMDCLGAHYNEGIVPPNQSGGDPRDNYYTRYFGTMLDVYWNISGGQKPICWTELGFLSPEGYPPLDPFFGWAQNVTVAQQAAWLAQAAALSSQSGRVRLMIVWNVDFSNYGADPMAGYAMIRADGSCPACTALAGAR
jgi:spore germination protein YaaH